MGEFVIWCIVMAIFIVVGSVVWTAVRMLIDVIRGKDKDWEDGGER